MTGGTNFQALADTPAGYYVGGDHRNPRLLCYIEASQDQSLVHFYSEVGVRDCPYGICCPWVRGGWGLDALGKFFRRRRRPRPLLFRQILEKK